MKREEIEPTQKKLDRAKIIVQEIGKLQVWRDTVLNGPNAFGIAHNSALGEPSGWERNRAGVALRPEAVDTVKGVLIQELSMMINKLEVELESL
jgi:hypothetical protein